MSSKKSYNRFFIIFQEEDKGYGMGPDRPPTGYAKVETKNDKSKVTVYVQNLKPFESGECLYRCYLISHQDDKDCTVYLGLMNIDDLGRGECSWECSADNAFDSKTAVEKFNGAAVVVDREGLDKVVAPLAGYMSKEKFDWRSKITIVKQSQPAPKEEVGEAIKEKTELNETAKKFEEYEKSIQEIIDKKVEVLEEHKEEKIEVVHEEHKEEKVEAVHEEQKIETEEIVEEDENEIIAPPIPENNIYFEGLNWDKREMKEPEPEPEPEEMFDDPRHKHKEHKYEYHGCPDYCNYNCRHVIKKMLEEMLGDCVKMDKHDELIDCCMWKVDMEKYRRDFYKITTYPCYDLIFYPMLFNYYKYIYKHNHYLFGIKYDKDKKVQALVFALPGRKTVYDQPYEGKTGFTRWVPWGMGGDGYWIMMYDPMTGIVVTQK